MSVIEIEGLTKRDGERTVLEGIDLAVEEGEVFGLLGPDGAGKTTVIDLLLDVVRPTGGSATVFGHDARNQSDAVRDRVGVLPDTVDLWERSSGVRHLAFAIDATDGNESPDDLLERVGLSRAAAERPVGNCSSRTTRRLAMAMALAGDPDLLLLDEPTSGLDSRGTRLFRDLVREAAADGTTVLLSSDDLGDAAVCDRVGVLDAGELVAVDSRAGLCERFGVASRLVVDVAEYPIVDLSGVDGVTGVTADADHIEVTYADRRAKALVLHRIVESGPPVVDFRVEEGTLEDLLAAVDGTAPAASDGTDRRRALAGGERGEG